MPRTSKYWLLLAALVISACSTGTPDAPPEHPVAAIATGLQAPWSMTYADDSLLLSERDSGRILEVLESGETREVARLSDALARGEGGLLGLAFLSPDSLYAYSTGASGNRIQRFTLQGSPGNLSLGTPQTLIDRLPSANIHNGGRLALGPDSMLYASVGDAGNPEQAQDLSQLAGKILRLTPEGKVPEDNPFRESYVYSWGHRNVQGMAWAEDGTMYASEFGQNTWDELNRIEAGGNYGWPRTEGAGTSADGFIPPIAQWKPSEASPSGIAVHDGTLYLANLRGQVLRAVNLADPSEQTELLAGQHGRLRDVLMARDGQLLVLSNNTDGRGNPGKDDDQILGVKLP